MTKPHFRTAKNGVVQECWTGENGVQKSVQNKTVHKQYVIDFLDKLRTALGQARPYVGQIKTTLKPIRLECPVHGLGHFAPDSADLNEKDFSDLLSRFTDLVELEGFANRRKILNAPQLKRFSDWQRDLILQRKWEIQNDAK